MAIVSRQQLLSQLMPGLNELFEKVYAERSEELDVVPYIKEVDFDEPEQK